MSLFVKQDFNPPVLSRRWIAIKFRPNMVIYSRENIIIILESGLLFREDSIEVEQESPQAETVWRAAGGGKNGWLTRGERVATVTSVLACAVAFPPRSLQRSMLLYLLVYSAIPLAFRWHHRSRCRGSLVPLLALMREYLALARRTAACLKEFSALYTQLGSVTSVLQWTHSLLCKQQSELSVLLSRASSAVLGNAPWLTDDVAWDAVTRDSNDNLMKIHHAFLVVQSTFLKHIAMAHFIPPLSAQRIYKNHNERLYWLHNSVLPHLTQEFQENFDSLQRMYRLLKNSANKESDTKKLGTAFNDSWLYSEVHTGIAKSSLELKLASNKCNNLDIFLDSCAMSKLEIDLNVLNQDIDEIIDSITQCLKTIQNSQIRLKKIQNRNVKECQVSETEEIVEQVAILKIEDKEPESKDEVFYFVKTDDDVNCIQPAEDLTTAPGKKEKDTKIVVLGELKRKLGKREDIMRERERQALAKTMPELKNIPEFPRQINFDEFVDRKGYITKIKKKVPIRKKLSIELKKNKPRVKIYRLKTAKYNDEKEINDIIYEANANFNLKSKLLTVNTNNNNINITKWCKYFKTNQNPDTSDFESFSDLEPSTSKHTIDKKTNEIRFTKKDLELSPSSSDSDFEFYKEKQQALLNDVRKHRVVRKKNYPNHRPSIDNVDESLKPIEYSFGTGMAMASVLQVSKKMPSYLANEEVFIGDGEVSTDSGNDEDA